MTLSYEELSRLWHKLNSEPPTGWEDDIKTMLDAIADLQTDYDLAIRTAAMLREQRDTALDEITAIRARTT